MNTAYTESLSRLIEEFGRLPGIGPKTAERLAFHVLKTPKTEAMGLATAIQQVKDNIRRCDTCCNLSEGPTCGICADPKRDPGLICIVEQPKDIVSLEKTGVCQWVYHVLGGHIAPLEGVDPSDLTLDRLMQRIRSGTVKEVVMATNPNMEGDGTALYISSLLRGTQIRITRLARGLPSGSTIEYASGKILTDAIMGRQNLD
ncbi:MAG: recombination protein RecR [Planctomycetes bacterium]|nr:recombination protein RecR [Planctomycetota bacterium]